MAAGTELQEKEMMSKSQRLLSKTKDPLERLRLQCLARGTAGIKGFAKVFRIMDDDSSKTLNLEEFSEGIRDYGLTMTDEELQELFQICDADESGSINFDEFLVHIRPPMSNARISIIDLAFNKLDKSNDGVVTVADLKGVYNAKHHPKYENGEWTEDQVFERFLKNFDSPNQPDCKVTKQEFINYYAGLSASIDNDMYFDVMMRKAWGL